MEPSRQALLPVVGQQLGVLGDGVDIGRQRQGDDIGLQPVDHGAGLGARAAIGGVERDRVAGLGFPLRGKAVAQILVKLAGGIVADIEQRDIGGLRAWSRRKAPPRPEGTECVSCIGSNSISERKLGAQGDRRKILPAIDGGNRRHGTVAVPSR